MIRSRFTYLVCIVSIVALIPNWSVGQEKQLVIDDTVIAKLGPGKSAFVESKGRYVLCWDSETTVDGQKNVETIVYPTPDISEVSSFKLALRYPWRVFFSNTSIIKEYALRKNSDGKGFTIIETVKGIESKTFSIDLASERCELEGLSASNVAIVNNGREVFAYSLNNGNLRKLLYNTQFGDTIAIDKLEEAMLYFPANSVDAGFAVNFEDELAPLFIVPGFSAYSADKIVQEGNNRIPKLFAPPQGNVESAAISLEAKLSAAVVQRAFCNPSIFIWKDGLLIDLLPLPDRSFVSFLGFSGSHLIAINSNRRSNQSDLIVMKLDDREPIVQKQTIPIPWKCLSAGLVDSGGYLIAVDQDRQIHKIMLPFDL